MEGLKIIECPRDAMQGVKSFIPTEIKVEYLQFLLGVGFHTLDFGSFVSPRAVPQMCDTSKVVNQLDLSVTQTKLLAIVANQKGAETALDFEQIQYIGYPFSISENFQMRNTHKTISESLDVLEQIKRMTDNRRRTLVVYLSMGFGNPYGDPWSVDIVAKWVEQLVSMGIEIISLSDTVGQAIPADISFLFHSLIPAFPSVEFGAHFHTHPNAGQQKIAAAFHAGCQRFDSAIQGYGGCPMASDALVGNMPTEKLLTFCSAQGLTTGLHMTRFESAINRCKNIFSEFQ